MAFSRNTSDRETLSSSTSTQPLSARHRAELRDNSGISDEVIEARGYRTIIDATALAEFGFGSSQRRAPGLLLPGHAPDGTNGFYCYKPDNPRVLIKKAKQRIIKYELPIGIGVRLDAPPTCRAGLGDPNVPLWITEGQKKSDALASRHLCALTLFGVNGFKGKNPLGGVTVLADFDFIALKNRDVRVVFDSDVKTNPHVQSALRRLTEHLQRKGAHVSIAYLPGGRDSKVGVDDYLLSHTVGELESLLEGPRKIVTAAVPTVELLDDAPLQIRRPLSILGEYAYCAIWPHVKETTTETKDADGNIVTLNPPLVATKQRLLIVRSDGEIFGAGGSRSRSMKEIGVEVKLQEIPSADRLWSARAVKAFQKGERPTPESVFNRIATVVDRFIDFDRSLADQRTMSELIACYVLATWFLDAFTVIGFLWPNGERGSGKTQLLTLVAELGYLGHLLLAGGSFAALRDLADYGATLCFDDAEQLSDPKKTDPDKRTLLLAGNRRGNTIPVKEPGSDRTWTTRYVNTFCPRAFSAIRLPDPVLASRTITVPLIRTPDRNKANADPLDYKLWPHNRRQLINDSWALALTHLPRLPVYESHVNERAGLTGRNLEPWRAILAIALWVDESGVTGLWQRMESLSVAYQGERQEFESGDWTALTIRALAECLDCEVVRLCEVCEVESEAATVKHFVRTADVEAAAKKIAIADELDMDVEKLSSRRLGRLLAKLRFNKGREGGTGKYGWNVSLSEVARYARALGLITPNPEQSFASASDRNLTNLTKPHNLTPDELAIQQAECEAIREEGSGIASLDDELHKA